LLLIEERLKDLLELLQHAILLLLLLCGSGLLLLCHLCLCLRLRLLCYWLIRGTTLLLMLLALRQLALHLLKLLLKRLNLRGELDLAGLCARPSAAVAAAAASAGDSCRSSDGSGWLCLRCGADLLLLLRELLPHVLEFLDLPLESLLRLLHLLDCRSRGDGLRAKLLGVQRRHVGGFGDLRRRSRLRFATSNARL
jgi:hypothetical protein